MYDEHVCGAEADEGPAAEGLERRELNVSHFLSLASSALKRCGAEIPRSLVLAAANDDVTIKVRGRMGASAACKGGRQNIVRRQLAARWERWSGSPDLLRWSQKKCTDTNDMVAKCPPRPPAASPRWRLAQQEQRARALHPLISLIARTLLLLATDDE